MISKNGILIPILCSGLVVSETSVVQAQTSSSGNFGNIVSSGDKAAIYGGIAAAAAIVGIGIYLVVRKASITGCTESGGNGLVLRTDRANESYSLTGDVAQLKAGEHVRVSGKRNRKDHTFVVSKVSQDLGSCQASAASR